MIITNRITVDPKVMLGKSAIRGTRTNRNAALAWQYRAWNDYRDASYAEALDAACQALVREPGGYEPLLVQGLAYEKVGSHTLAARSLRSFLRRSKGSDLATYDRRKVKHELATSIRRSDAETDR